MSQQPFSVKEAKPPFYDIEYQPRLVEEVVLRVIVGHAEEPAYRQERDALYSIQDQEEREEAFQVLNAKWYERLGLSEPLQQVLETWPILKSRTHTCVLVKARSKKDVGAELYVAATNGHVDRESRSLVIQVTPELLAQSEPLLTFLRRELLHIVDMLDPEFGYQPTLPISEMGPTHQRFLQERYRVLWDIIVDGRLLRRGWLPASIRDQHRKRFLNTFAGPPRDLETVFVFFFEQWPHTHQELVSFCCAPETWFVSANPVSTSKGHCSLCNLPSFDLIGAKSILPRTLLAQIQDDNPHWQAEHPICRHCADLYELRLK
ncbi:hypothetical protein GWO43_05880 [candidate division KSB1 bacterium]|nr:hypothetical protein [candidate division KSB1 bacterium]NIT70417.1 hypothetical protein [candidate division KSB1 bacterium]NIW68479.1 hypothetical protein [candidate division KSB1 bacterium]NIX70098.1 hypothetical protein [candidate division KSB1 bacterium]